MRLRGVGAALLVLTSWMSSVALAQVHDDEARGLYLAGAAAYDEGRFEEALAYFQRSYELSPRPELLYNIGQAADRSRQDAVALDAFRRYLEARPDVPERATLEGRIRALEAALERGTPATAPEPEPRAVVAPAPTIEPEARVEAPAVVAAPSEEAAPAVVPSERTTDDGSTGPDAGGITLIVVGGALAVGGAVLMALGVPDTSAVANPRPDEMFYAQALSRQEAGLAMAWSGGAAIGVGVVLAVVGAIVLGTSGGEDDVALDAHGLRVSF